MKTARSTTNKAPLSRKVSQTVLHAAQITAAAFLTLLLVVGLQAVASATVAFGPSSGPGHWEAQLR